MYLTIPSLALWAVIVLVLCALGCVGVLLRKAKGTSLRLSSFEEALNESEAKITQEVKEHQQAKRDLEIRGKTITNLQGRIKDLEGSLTTREAEVTRLQRLVKKAEQDANDAREERDKQTNRANDENVTRLNAESQLFAARHGEDPETECFYRDHPGLLTPAPAEPAEEAAAELAAEEIAPAEEEEKPKAVKKRSTKG